MHGNGAPKWAGGGMRTLLPREQVELPVGHEMCDGRDELGEGRHTDCVCEAPGELTPGHGACEVHAEIGRVAVCGWCC
eukprot:3819227-Pyramimonas_sp.AAC.1